jgi:hypothetical protein
MTAQQGEDWLISGRNGHTELSVNGADDRKKPTTRKRWFPFRDTISPGPLKAKTFLTYFIVSLLVGINILLIAHNDFAADSTRFKDLLYSGDHKAYDASGLGGDVDKTLSPAEEGSHGSRTSPMSCDLCPPDNEFCKSIG